MDRCFNRDSGNTFTCSYCGHTLFLEDTNCEPALFTRNGTRTLPQYCPGCGKKIVSKDVILSQARADLKGIHRTIAYVLGDQLSKLRDEDDYKRVRDDWHEVFIHVAKAFGIDDRSIIFLWCNMSFGEVEYDKAAEDKKYPSVRDKFQAFQQEVYFSCNRWSFDRLARCHWRYRQYMRSIASIEDEL